MVSPVLALLLVLGEAARKGQSPVRGIDSPLGLRELSTTAKPEVDLGLEQVSDEKMAGVGETAPQHSLAEAERKESFAEQKERRRLELLRAAQPQGLNANLGSGSIAERFMALGSFIHSKVVDWLFASMPVTLYATPDGKSTRMAILTNLWISGDLPAWLIYVYPLVCFLLITSMWAICCRHSDRSDLSVRLVCESMCCSMCLWADLVTQHRVLSKSRAWGYAGGFLLLVLTWNILQIFITGKDETKVLSLCFGAVLTFLWICWAIERTFTRMYFRRYVNPGSKDLGCLTSSVDCVLHLFFAPLTALQEGQHMSHAPAPKEVAQTAW